MKIVLILDSDRTNRRRLFSTATRERRVSQRLIAWRFASPRTALAAWCLMSLAAWCLASVAAVNFAAESSDHFFDRVQPLLAGKCVSCHGPEKQEGGLRLDSLEAAKKGGDRGPALVPGDLEKSWLVRSIRFDDPDLQMPPKNKLAAGEIAAIER
ncbi:MAG TPA: hypothetical protein PLV92_17990, partial [Pirellulaceae bacterium]|nr:hypothetical protein [Pirellulaceae bacterium]